MLALHVRLIHAADGITKDDQLAAELLRNGDDAVVVRDAAPLQHDVTVVGRAQGGPLRLQCVG